MPREEIDKRRKSDPLSVNFAEFVSFSSFGTTYDTQWAQHLERPYEIVARPGIAGPYGGIEKRDRDAMWLETPAPTETVVWDGYNLNVLHEIILECLDRGGAGRHYFVRNKKTGDEMPDMRDPRVMYLRPPRKAAPETEYEMSERYADLYIWAHLVGRYDFGASSRGPSEVYFVACDPLGREDTGSLPVYEWYEWCRHLEEARYATADPREQAQRDIRLGYRTNKTSPLSRGPLAWRRENAPHQNIYDPKERITKVLKKANLHDILEGGARVLTVDAVEKAMTARISALNAQGLRLQGKTGRVVYK